MSSPCFDCCPAQVFLVAGLAMRVTYFILASQFLALNLKSLLAASLLDFLGTCLAFLA